MCFNDGAMELFGLELLEISCSCQQSLLVVLKVVK